MMPARTHLEALMQSIPQEHTYDLTAASRWVTESLQHLRRVDRALAGEVHAYAGTFFSVDFDKVYDTIDDGTSREAVLMALEDIDADHAFSAVGVGCPTTTETRLKPEFISQNMLETYLKVRCIMGSADDDLEESVTAANMPATLPGYDHESYTNNRRLHNIAQLRPAPRSRIFGECADLEHQLERALFPLNQELAAASLAAYNNTFRTEFQEVIPLYILLRTQGKITEENLRQLYPTQTMDQVYTVIQDMLGKIEPFAYGLVDKSLLPSLDDYGWEPDFAFTDFKRNQADLEAVQPENFEILQD
jgi:hypothetical protein